MIAVREADDADLPAILALLQGSLGWLDDDLHARFFAWKHHESPFGPSPGWVALDGRRIVGFRTFMRWELERDGRPVAAARAVDTATHPDYRGRGMFTRLTLHALEALRDQGVAFVFNTPNDQSRPGYLKMGWRPVRRLPVAVRPRSVASLVRVAGARTAADKWSVETTAGLPAADAVADLSSTGSSLPGPDSWVLTSSPDHAVRNRVPKWPLRGHFRTQSAGAAGTMAGSEGAPGHRGPATRRSPAYLAWRYGYVPLRYRALRVRSDAGSATAIFRLRRRGRALEAAVCEELLLSGDGGCDAGRGGNGVRLRAQLHRAVLRATGADHAVVVGPPHPAHGLLPVPGQGPTLVWRDVCETAMPAADDWCLSLGDVELF